MKFVFQSPQNPNSHLTIKERNQSSFPVRHILKNRLIKGRVLDFGSGLGADVTFLQEKGIDITGYDPYYSPTIPQGKFDTILCIYVLNVLLPEEQSHVLMAISELLKPGGIAFFAVRRDILRDGFRTHIKHGVNTYQCNVKLPYRSILVTNHCEIYAYKHITYVNHGKTKECLFCAPDATRVLITESATAYAILDKFPVSPGHALIIPKKHIPDYFDLSFHAKNACWLVVDRVKMLLDEKYKPDGYNVGVNSGASAGQTIPHVHIHIIPRFYGDVENPTGGVRSVIPGKSDYTRKN